MSEIKKTSKAPGFTPEERAAMKERAKELKTQANREESTQAVLEKIAGLDEPDRTTARRIHEIVSEVAPGLTPRLWYGSPAYADAAGKIVCFFQERAKFTTRYSTFGFQEAARLDDGTMWPTSYAILELSRSDEKAIAELVRRATG